MFALDLPDGLNHSILILTFFVNKYVCFLIKYHLKYNICV